MKDFKWEPKYTAISIYAFLVIAASLLFGAFIYNFKDFWGFANTLVRYLVPFVYGFGLAFVLSPLLRLFEKMLPASRMSGRLRRNLALLITYLAALALLVLLLVVVIPTLAQSVTALAKNIAYYSTQVDVLVADLLALIPVENIPKEIINAIDGLITSVTNYVVNFLFNAVTVTTQLTAGVIDVVMGVIISIYMLTNKELLFAQCKKLLYALLPDRFVSRLIRLAHDSNIKFSGFLVGKIIDSIIIGLLCALGMWIFKMPFITLVSLIIGVTNIIPYFGPFIGAIPGIILVFIGGGWLPALGFAIFVLFLQQFDGNILGPAILGQSTGLDAMWVIFAILLFGGLYGFVGMLIGVPLLSVIFGLIGEFIHMRLEKKGLSKELPDYASEKHRLLSQKRVKK